jgi:hypothetical protein
VFDTVRTLQFPDVARSILRTRGREGKFDIFVFFADEFSWEDDALESYFAGGKYGSQLLRTDPVEFWFFSLFRAVMYRWHRFHYVRHKSFDFEFTEGEATVVEGIVLQPITIQHFGGIKWIIFGSNRRHRCVVAQEDSRLFLVPSVERENQPYAFKTLYELVKHYQRELAWLQIDSEEVPPECAWLSSMLSTGDEIAL